MENKNNSRRSFLRSAAKGAVVAVVTPTTFAMGEPANTIHSSIIGANDRIRVAILGLNGRGKTHVEEIMNLSAKSNVEVVALCDPDMVVLNEAAANFQKKYGKKKKDKKSSKF